MGFKNFLILISIFYCFSCAKEKNKSNINLNKITEVSVFDFFDSIEVVQLETTDESLIRRIDEIIKIKGKYFILDTREQCVFCFDDNGKFLHKIANKGRGPEEYIYIGHINIDPYNNHLLLLEPFGTLHRYQFDGQFISKTILPVGGVAYNEIYAVNSDTLVVLSLNKFQVFYCSLKADTIFKNMLPQLRDGFSNLYRSYYYNDSVYFCSQYDNEVLNLSDISTKKVFTWDFGEANNSKKNIENAANYMMEMKQKEISHDVYKNFIWKYLNTNIFICFENMRFLYSSVAYNYDFYNVFIDKITQQQYVFVRTIEGITFIGATCFNNYFILPSDRTPPYAHKDENFTHYNKDILSPKNIEIIEQHDAEDDNPYLIVYKLKS